MKTFLFTFKSVGNTFKDQGIVVSSPSLDKAYDSFWCWARLQPWYQRTWKLEIEVCEVLHIDNAPSTLIM